MATIRTLDAPFRHEIDKIRGSRFITSVQPVQNAEQIDAFLDACRLEFRDATHNCFAWRLSGSDHMRYSDDGEPSGTAGRPILREIDGRGLVDVAVVVTRYYGGTKLGTGGLMRAYGGAAAQTLDLCPVVEHRIMATFEIRFDYSLTGPMQAALAAHGLTPVAADYGAQVLLRLAVPIEEEAAVRAALVDAGHGAVEIREVASSTTGALPGTES